MLSPLLSRIVLNFLSIFLKNEKRSVVSLSLSVPLFIIMNVYLSKKKKKISVINIHKGGLEVERFYDRS